MASSTTGTVGAARVTRRSSKTWTSVGLLANTARQNGTAAAANTVDQNCTVHHAAYGQKR